jgi:hypothetical protein
MSEEEKVEVVTSHPEVGARFLAGVREAQRWGGGFGEPSPAGTSVDAETGDLEHVEKPKDEEEQKPADGVEPSSEEAAEETATDQREAEAEEATAETDLLLDRLEGYIARLRRARSSS